MFEEGWMRSNLYSDRRYAVTSSSLLRLNPGVCQKGTNHASTLMWGTAESVSNTGFDKVCDRP